MALKPELSLGASLAVIGLDYGIAQMTMPNLADIKASKPHSQPIDSARKSFIWTAVSASAALSLVTRDPNIFVFGAGFAVALDWFYRHANATHPATGEVTLPPMSGTSGPGGVPAYGE